MKKTLIAFLLGISITGLIAFTAVKYEAKKSTAEVEQMQGLYVFIHSKPVMEYEYLGSFTPSLVPSSKARSIINYVIKKGKEKYYVLDILVWSNYIRFYRIYIIS